MRQNNESRLDYIHVYTNIAIKYIYIYIYLIGGKVKATQSCPTLCDSMDYNPPGSSVHGILQARMLEWVAISFSRGSSQPRHQTQVTCIAGRFSTL